MQTELNGFPLPLSALNVDYGRRFKVAHITWKCFFPTPIMKISQDPPRVMMTFWRTSRFCLACLLFCKMLGHTLLPGALWLSDYGVLSACRSILLVNNLLE